MITATVRYKLPPHIDYPACREHFHKIAPGFREVKGLISKHFIWNESGWAAACTSWSAWRTRSRSIPGPGSTAVTSGVNFTENQRFEIRCFLAIVARQA